MVSEKLHEYASAHRVYPTPPDTGPLSRAGLYAPTLVSEHRLVADDGTLIELVRTMGGDYGYTLGYRDAGGVLQPYRDQRRVHHPLMADAPDDGGEASSNHPEGLHHVLYEDGHVEIHRVDTLHRDDHLYRNHDGVSRAGKDAEDAVIGDSHHQP